MINDEQISVIIVTFNSQVAIKKCIQTLLSFYPHSPIYIIDNNSTDETVNIVKKFSQVRLIQSMENLGFSKANNLASESIQTKFVCFLNPDTVLLNKQNLINLAEDLEQNEKFGLVGPKIIHPDGRIQKTVRNLPTLRNAFLEYVLNHQGSYDFYQPKSSVLVIVPSITGAVMMLKTELFRKVGGFSEKFFLYYEDLDLCQKIANSNLKIGYDPQVVISHIMGASGKKVDVNQLLIESAKKYHGLIEYYLITFIIRLGLLIHRHRFT
ncbi:glycosyltransferase family 2 protein [Patescibacteria group bacterium]|nr:glycosyltransferase family 2 protein [Patescibacteria group bacterium]